MLVPLTFFLRLDNLLNILYFHRFTPKQNNILISDNSKKDGMLSSANFPNIMITLILFSLPILSHSYEVKAQSSSVADTGSGTGIISCPSGDQHEGPIIFKATSTASSVTGEWDISTHGPSGDLLKSGIITAGNISPSGQFILTGKESSDNICNGLGIASSISIEITGGCVSGPGVLTTVKFMASNGERADFLSSPICT